VQQSGNSPGLAGVCTYICRHLNREGYSVDCVALLSNDTKVISIDLPKLLKLPDDVCLYKSHIL